MELLLIGAATSADIFAAAVGISAGRIKFPAVSALAAAFSGAAVLWLSAFLSEAVDKMLPLEQCIYIPKIILFTIGLYSIFGERIKKKLPKKAVLKRCTFHYTEVMNDPLISDSDNSKSISVAEAVVMGIALSADSVFMGISAGIAGISPAMIFLCSLLFGTAAIAAGTFLGRYLASKLSFLSSVPVGGIILILLSVII